MTRRRVLALIFGTLIVIFVAGSVATVTAVRSQLIDDVDDSLRAEVAGVAQAFDELDVADLERLISPVNERAFIRIDPLGAVELTVPAGAVTDPIALPDLPASRIIDRVGEVFSVDGTDGGPKYRVASAELANGDFIAVAQPLDDVRSTISSLARTLLITLFAMLLVLGAIFWWLLRLSMRPYDDMIDTAQAISGGALDRRIPVIDTDPGFAHLTTSLNTMLDRIQASFEAKEAAEGRVKQFAADASHELRTPITTIAGYSELYLSGAATDPDAVTKQMTRINSEAGRMGRLVEALLTLTRLDEGSSLDMQELDIRAAVATAVNDRRAAKPKSLLTGPTAHESDTPIVVAADPDAIQQLMINLLTNASRHAPGARVDVSTIIDGDQAVIRVADDGPGMAADVAAKIYDRFFRADSVRSSSSESFGLGLPIVACIVDSLGGSIEVDTAPGEGSAFTVKLPLARRDEPQSEIAAATPQ